MSWDTTAVLSQYLGVFCWFLNHNLNSPKFQSSIFGTVVPGKSSPVHYRTNYFIMIVFILGLGFLRRPLTIIAAAFTALSVALLNDSFAGTFNEKVTRTVRKFSPHLAARMRPPLTSVIRGRPSAKRAIYICGQPRWVFVLIFSSASFILGFDSCGLLTVLWAFAIGLLGGTFALFSLLCQHARLSILPNQQDTDEMLSSYAVEGSAET